MNRREVLMGTGAMAIAGLATADAQVTADTVYELRIYHLNDGKQPLILERFRSRETVLFERAGMHPVAYWVPTEEPLVGKTLIYMLRHKSREAAKESWAKFQADPEWVSLKAESEKDGKFVDHIESTFMKLTDFSPKL